MKAHFFTLVLMMSTAYAQNPNNIHLPSCQVIVYDNAPDGSEDADISQIINQGLAARGYHPVNLSSMVAQTRNQIGIHSEADLNQENLVKACQALTRQIGFEIEAKWDSSELAHVKASLVAANLDCSSPEVMASLMADDVEIPMKTIAVSVSNYGRTEDYKVAYRKALHDSIQNLPRCVEDAPVTPEAAISSGPKEPEVDSPNDSSVATSGAVTQ